MKNFIIKCNKKAYKHIKHIRSAHNMLEVESAINSAIMHTFGTHNLGLIKIAMRNNYTLLLKEYGAGHYKNFETLKSMRIYNQQVYGNDVKAYLLSLVPERLRHSQMYRAMTA